MSVETLTIKATIAGDDLEDYEMCAELITKVIELQPTIELSKDQRNMLSSAFKSMIAKQRGNRRNLRAKIGLDGESEDVDYEDPSDEEKEVIKAYLTEVGEKLLGECEKAIKVIKVLVGTVEAKEEKDADVNETCAFYNKMIADYYRYEVEGSEGEDEKRAPLVEKASEYYSKAQATVQDLPHYNSTKLGLALNQSVFLYEIKEERTAAHEMAKGAADAAKSALDASGAEAIDPDTIEDAQVVIKLLEDNVNLWDSEAEEAAAAPPAGAEGTGETPPAEIAAGSPMNAVAALKAEAPAETPSE